MTTPEHAYHPGQPPVPAMATIVGQPLPPEQPQVPPTFQPQPPVPLPAYEQPVQAAPQPPNTVRIPEGGYAQRVVRIPLPRFALPGFPEPWIEMRNPGLMPQATLDKLGAALSTVEMGPDGEPTGQDEADKVFAQVLPLLKAWHMWDANDDSDNPPALPAPTSLDILKSGPSGVLIEVMKAFKELSNPQ